MLYSVCLASNCTGIHSEYQLMSVFVKQCVLSCRIVSNSAVVKVNGVELLAESSSNLSHHFQHYLLRSVISCMDESAAASAVFSAGLVLHDRRHSV